MSFSYSNNGDHNVLQALLLTAVLSLGWALVLSIWKYLIVMMMIQESWIVLYHQLEYIVVTMEMMLVLHVWVRLYIFEC